MALGRYTSDLEPGDVLGPVDYVMSKFVVREYCHAVEMHQACFQERDIPYAPSDTSPPEQAAPLPPCLPARRGTSARVHIEYDATIHAGVPVGVPLRVKGRVAERLIKRGREYVFVDIDLRTVADDRLLIAYRDTVITAYRASASGGDARRPTRAAS